MITFAIYYRSSDNPQHAFIWTVETDATMAQLDEMKKKNKVLLIKMLGGSDILTDDWCFSGADDLTIQDCSEIDAFEANLYQRFLLRNVKERVKEE